MAPVKTHFVQNNHKSAQKKFKWQATILVLSKAIWFVHDKLP